MPETAAKLLRALGGRRTSTLDGARVRRAARRRSGRDARAAVPEAASDRQPHPPRPHARRPTPRSWRAPRAAGVTRILTIGMDARLAPRRARRRRGPRRGVRGVGHHPNSATGFDGRRPDELRELARHPRCRGDRRDRARRLPRLRAARRPGARLRGADRRSRASSASRSSSTPARPRTTRSRSLAARRGGPGGDPALLLDARPARGVPRARLVDLLRRQRHLPEGGRTWPRRRNRSRSTACWWRPTRRT